MFTAALTFPVARVFYHTCALDVEVNPEMPQNRSRAVREGNGAFPPPDEFGSGEPTMVELYRILEETFDRMDKKIDRMTSCFDRRLNKLIGKTRETKQRLADLQDQAQQSRLATKADVDPDTKTCKRTRGATANFSEARG